MKIGCKVRAQKNRALMCGAQYMTPAAVYLGTVTVRCRTLRAFLAPASCSQGPKRPPGRACGLPAGCLPGRGCLLLEPLLRCRHCLSAWALLQRPHPCSGPVQSGGSRGCSGVLEVLCWRWVGAETCLVVKV